MNNECKRKIWKEAVVAQYEAQSVCRESLKNADISWNSRSTNRDLNPGHVENYHEWYTVE
jgi:hypothetical protein